MANVLSNAQLINQDSGKYEYYTPSWIIESARRVMGSIDLDPASSAKANQIVRASQYFDYAGHVRSWYSTNVWLNHPFSRKENSLWIDKLIRGYNSGHFKQACSITYASTSEKWFQPLMKFPQCYITGRVNYIDGSTGKEAKGVTKGSVVTYLGNQIDLFYEVFSIHGNVMLPYQLSKKGF